MNSMKTFALVGPSLKERRNLCSHIFHYSVCLHDCLVDILWTVTIIRNHGWISQIPQPIMCFRTFWVTLLFGPPSHPHPSPNPPPYGQPILLNLDSTHYPNKNVSNLWSKRRKVTKTAVKGDRKNHQISYLFTNVFWDSEQLMLIYLFIYFLIGWLFKISFHRINWRISKQVLRLKILFPVSMTRFKMEFLLHSYFILWNGFNLLNNGDRHIV